MEFIDHKVSADFKRSNIQSDEMTMNSRLFQQNNQTFGRGNGIKYGENNTKHHSKNSGARIQPRGRSSRGRGYGRGGQGGRGPIQHTEKKEQPVTQITSSQQLPPPIQLSPEYPEV